MDSKHILPEELAEMIRLIGVDLATGPEAEGGLIFLANIERILEKAGISSEYFGSNHPKVSNDVKIIMAIWLLYSFLGTKHNIHVAMPRYRRDAQGCLRPIPVSEHLETLAKLFKLCENPITF